jgi:hypothetical protein
METPSSFQQKRQTIPKQKPKKSETIFRLPPNTPSRKCIGIMHRTPAEYAGAGSGSRRVFEQFVWLGVGSIKVVLFRPAHQRLTPTVGWLRQIWNLVYSYVDEIERAFYNPVKELYHEKTYCAGTYLS